jgi:DNA-binding NtrC family response regulator
MSAPRTTGLAGTLLVVDDDSQIQLLLKLFFESKGLRVILAGSGEEALELLPRKPVLVVMDINMPGINGVDALKRMKQINRSLPVIMISGGGDEALANEALKSGAYDYISKPFNLEYLETVVLTKVLLGIEHED